MIQWLLEFTLKGCIKMRLKRLFLLLIFFICTCMVTSCNCLVDRSTILNKDDFNTIYYNGNKYIYREFPFDKIHCDPAIAEEHVGYVYHGYLNGIKEAFKCVTDENTEIIFIESRTTAWIRSDFVIPKHDETYTQEMVIYIDSIRYSINFESRLLSDIIVEVNAPEYYEIVTKTSLYFLINNHILYNSFDILKVEDKIYLREFYGEKLWYLLDESYYEQLDEVISPLCEIIYKPYTN